MTVPKTRFTADLEFELFQWLTEYSEREGISRNEAIKRAVLLLQKEAKK